MLFIVLVATLLVSPRAHADAPKVILKSIGVNGSASSEFAGAGQALAVNRTGAGGASAGDLFVLDAGNRRVQQFTKAGVFVRMFGKEVNKTVGTAHPDTCTAADLSAGDVCGAAAADSGAAGTIASTLGGIAIDHDTGVIYVSHPTMKRVDVFSSTGVFQGAFGWGVKAGDISSTGFTFCSIVTGCQAGFLGENGGQFNTSTTSPRGIGVNPKNGHVVVADSGGFRVQEFAPAFGGPSIVTGMAFVRAFGWNVVLSGPDNENQIENVIVKASGGSFHLAFESETTPDLPFDAPAGVVQAALEALPSIGASNVQVSGGPGESAGFAPYSVTFIGALAGKANGPLSAASGVPALTGTVSVPIPMNVGGAAQFEICDSSDICKAGAPGNAPGQLSGQTAPGLGGIFAELAVDSAGAVYVLSSPEGACDATTKVCRIQRFAPSGRYAEEFAPSELKTVSGNARAQSLAVDPANDHVFVAWHAASPFTRYEVREYTKAGGLVSTAPANASDELKSNSPLAGPVAVGLDERLYFSSIQNKVIYLLGPLPPPQVSSAACEAKAPQVVKCSGTVTIPGVESGGVATSYRFEYSVDGKVWARFPADGDKSIGQIPGPVAVSEEIAPLKPNTLYLFRLCATTAGTVCSESPVAQKTPGGAPTVGLTFTEAVTKTEATLGSNVNPEGSATKYFFEWGPTTAYGSRVLVGGRAIGEGNDSLVVTESIGGLQPQTIYHFRVVATNSLGSVPGPDTQFETLNACGLLEDRCFELVSPRDQGPIGESGGAVATGQELQFQAAHSGSSLAYILAYGSSTSTAGGEVLYRATRGTANWGSEQLAPSVSETSILNGGGAPSARYLFLSPDLQCGFLSSPEPLAAAAPTRVVDAGGVNLFLRKPDGSYEVVTRLTPSNLGATEGTDPLGASYTVVGAAADCSRVIFETNYEYPGIEFSGLYEWSNGVLSNAAVITGPGGPVAPDLTADSRYGPGAGRSNYRNAVSTDATKVAFSAARQVSENSLPAEVGKDAVFVKSGASPAVDVSRSRTATPNLGAVYQTASEDGSRVFFLANYGMTAAPSNGLPDSTCYVSGTRCDLYEFNFAAATPAESLVDLSASSDPANPQGAVVKGVLGASADGDYVYFAARGQLVSGAGNSYAKNLAGAGAYNVYLAHDGALSFVATITAEDLADQRMGLTVSRQAAQLPATLKWTSRVTPSGGHLLFQSRANITGYDSGGVAEAYLYAASTGKVACLSCRQDREPSAGGALTFPLPALKESSSNFSHPRLAVSSNGERAFFTMPDALAYGAVEGNINLYEWKSGQVALLATRPPSGLFNTLEYLGAGSSGADVFFSTPERLTPDDIDERRSVYVARVGGGFAPPPAPPGSCNPLLESACQGPPDTAGLPPSAPGSVSLQGSGNVSQPNSAKPKKGKKKKKGKKGKSGSKKQGKGKNRKVAGGKGRAGK